MVDPSLNFASSLYPAMKLYLMEWAKGEGSFVVVGLLDALSGSERDELVFKLQAIETSLKESSEKGTNLILEKISQ